MSLPFLQNSLKKLCFVKTTENSYLDELCKTFVKYSRSVSRYLYIYKKYLLIHINFTPIQP